MPNPSASSKTKLAAFKIFWPRLIYLNVVKYFWPCSNMQIYKVKYHFWPRSKKFERIQEILNTAKKIWAWSKYFWTSRWNRNFWQKDTFKGHVTVYQVDLSSLASVKKCSQEILEKETRIDLLGKVICLSDQNSCHNN